MSFTIELVSLFVAIVAFFIPAIISLYERSSKLRKAVFLKELIQTRDDLKKILSQTDNKEQPILYHRLESILLDIEKEINPPHNPLSVFARSFYAIIYFLVFLGSLYAYIFFTGQYDGDFFNNYGPYHMLFNLGIFYYSFSISKSLSEKLGRSSSGWLAKLAFPFLRIVLLILIHLVFIRVSLFLLYFISPEVLGAWFE